MWQHMKLVEEPVHIGDSYIVYIVYIDYTIYSIEDIDEGDQETSYYSNIY